MEIYHVLPIDDLKPHTESGMYCKCQPEIIEREFVTMVVHYSYDGREFFEENGIPKGH